MDLSQQQPTSIGDLSQIYGSWNPETYTQGRNNVALSDMFQQQKQQMGQNTIDQGMLQNVQSAQMNPLLVQQQGITNQNAQNNADISGVAANRATTNAPFILNQDQADMANKMKEADLMSAELHGQKLAMSDNPIERAQGEHILAGTSAVRSIRMKSDAEARVAGIHAGATLGAAGIGANASTTNETLRAASGERIEAARADAMKQAAISRGGLPQQYGEVQRNWPEGPEKQAKLADLTLLMQTANAPYASGINLPGATGGTIQRNVELPKPTTTGKTKSGATYTIVPTQ